MGAQKFSSDLDDAIKIGGAAEKIKALTKDTEKNDDRGYTRGSREDMDRLIQTRTKN